MHRPTRKIGAKGDEQKAPHLSSDRGARDDRGRHRVLRVDHADWKMARALMINVISLGAGVQSSTMALMAAVGEITPLPECAIFADTQAEPPSVYDWLDWLENQLPFPVHRVTAGDLGAASLELRTSKRSGNVYTRTQDSVTTGVPFLHSSLRPLDQVQFVSGQGELLFGNECEGMCGV